MIFYNLKTDTDKDIIYGLQNRHYKLHKLYPNVKIRVFFIHNLSHPAWFRSRLFSLFPPEKWAVGAEGCLILRRQRDSVAELLPVASKCGIDEVSEHLPFDLPDVNLFQQQLLVFFLFVVVVSSFVDCAREVVLFVVVEFTASLSEGVEILDLETQ